MTALVVVYLGRSTGRVVFPYDSSPAAAAGLDVAFARARRHGIGLGLTVLPVDPDGLQTRATDADDPLCRWRYANPDIPLREQLVSEPMEHALATASAGAALVVMPQRRRRFGLLAREPSSLPAS
ncbi:hypothetical protein [Nocardia neocaledoniensis]|uniref:hypothetical protein n=1 Tax=Nocardia neocaledoniensis TaxID=236511 RepID=UPI0011B73E29|nr:hypothetical protein [Nocardia neocaledoniensis]